MGYIKLHRKIFDWEWYGKPNMVTLWLHLLLSANYEDKVWRGVLVERGSFMTSLSTLAAETGLSIQEVRTCLNKLQNSTQINIQSTHQATKIIICNYESYQCKDQDEQQTTNTQPNNKITTTKEDNTSSSTNVDSEDIIQEERKKKDSGTKVPSQKEVVDRIYSLYPNKCPVKGRPTGKSKSDKKKIERELLTYGEEKLSWIIKKYISDCIKSQTPIKNFQTFLNNIPDYDEQGDGLFSQQEPARPEPQRKTPEQIAVDAFNNYERNPRNVALAIQTIWGGSVTQDRINSALIKAGYQI